MKFVSIGEAKKKGKGKIAVRGWVHRERGSSNLKFVVLRDSTDLIQCVFDRKNFEKQWPEIDGLRIESSVEIEGLIKKDKRSPTGYEIQAKAFNLVGKADNFPITKDQSAEFLADNRHLWLRSRKMTAIMRVRSTLLGAIHEFFRKNGYLEFHSPIFTANACEGGSTIFTVDYYGKPVYLAQSWQLPAEAGIFALEKIYTIAPSFRAEKSKTSRHLTEYWHAEVETAWQDFRELQGQGEALVKFVVQKILKENKKDLEALGRDIKKLEPTVKKKFPRMTYSKALELLKEKKNHVLEWGKDLRTIEEDKLMELFDVPIIVTNYPKQVKAFYMKEAPEDSKTVLGYDMLAPEGYGELIGGSERETDADELIRKLKAEGEDQKIYGWYLDLRKYGSIPHSGFGLGVERLLSWICGLDNIKDAIAFPRTMRRHTP